jgi:hypothetical protein
MVLKLIRAMTFIVILMAAVIVLGVLARYSHMIR